MTTQRIGIGAAQMVLRNPAFIEPFTLTRQAPGTRSKGIYQPGALTSSDLEGSIQDLTGEERRALPEAYREDDAVCVLYETQDHDLIRALRRGASDQTNPDIITRASTGFQYAVRVVHDMADYGHVEIHATKIEGQDG